MWAGVKAVVRGNGRRVSLETRTAGICPSSTYKRMCLSARERALACQDGYTGSVSADRQ